MTEIRLWTRLGTCSRRAMLKRKARFGRPYFYQPRGDLLQRLSRETGLSIDDVYQQLQKERDELLNDRIQ